MTELISFGVGPFPAPLETGVQREIPSLVINPQPGTYPIPACSPHLSLRSFCWFNVASYHAPGLFITETSASPLLLLHPCAIFSLTSIPRPMSSCQWGLFSAVPKTDPPLCSAQSLTPAHPAMSLTLSLSQEPEGCCQDHGHIAFLSLAMSTLQLDNMSRMQDVLTGPGWLGQTRDL